MCYESNMNKGHATLRLILVLSELTFLYLHKIKVNHTHLRFTHILLENIIYYKIIAKTLYKYN